MSKVMWNYALHWDCPTHLHHAKCSCKERQQVLCQPIDGLGEMAGCEIDCAAPECIDCGGDMVLISIGPPLHVACKECDNSFEILN
jgi:hypothetical protein